MVEDDDNLRCGHLDLNDSVVTVTEGLERVLDLEPLPGKDDYRPRGGFIESDTVDGVVTFRTTDRKWDAEAWMRAIPPHLRMPNLRPEWHDESEGLINTEITSIHTVGR